MGLSVNLTFKGFLRWYCRELTGLETDNLRKLRDSVATSMPAAAEALMVFAAVQDKAGYLATISQGTWMESSYAQMAEQLRDPEEVSFYLQSPEAPPRYRAVWNAYIAKRYAIAGERRIIAGMREKTLQAMEGRNVTVYRLCKDLGLNKGNIYAFLGKGDDTKVSQGTARRILEYACKAS